MLEIPQQPKVGAWGTIISEFECFIQNQTALITYFSVVTYSPLDITVRQRQRIRNAEHRENGFQRKTKA